MTTLTNEWVLELVTTYYGVTVDEVTFLGTSDSTAYQIVSGSFNYLLKMHNVQSQAREVQSELEWLRALDLETDLRVQRPVQNLAGKLFTEQDGVIYTLQHWVAGQHVETLTEWHLERLSNLLLSLHMHAMRWEPPGGFTRPVYSVDQVQSLMADLASSSLMSAEEEKLMTAASECITKIVGKHPVSRENWGLIHSDMHDGNYLLHEDRLHAIDFSCCGFGYYLFDLAEPLLHMMPDDRKHFVCSYAEKRDVQIDVELLEAFYLWQVLRNFTFLTKNPEEHDGLRQSIPRVCERFVAPFLAGERFLGI
ncbi:phosphotransferase enzyme family protein [Chryseomicrobium palamuruense]|uniref:Phosphotransferase enzyme family protein n=1 Tax=Chryseomicrobium palamuruense TaxID=682973 RepID=A0ABV8UX35_9BACL